MVKLYSVRESTTFLWDKAQSFVYVIHIATCYDEQYSTDMILSHHHHESNSIVLDCSRFATVISDFSRMQENAESCMQDVPLSLT